MKMTLRSSVRFGALNLATLGVVLSVTGAGTPTLASPGQAAVEGQDVELGAAYAIESSRISAAEDGEWAFAAPAITVEERVIPVVLRRSVTNNPVPASIEGNAILEEAAKFVGSPYLAGGGTPAGFDCSGFVSYVYAQFGVSLPRSSDAYYSIGTRVSAEDARPGDLIVSSGHVAIYAGESMQVDSPRPGKTVQFRSIWQSSYVFVRVS
jgi:cell wall-associated NlpC family hydrolase